MSDFAKARKGDLAVIEVRRSYSMLSCSKDYSTYEVGVVDRTDREGRVKAVRSVFGFTTEERWLTIFVLGRNSVDVAALTAAAKTREPEPGMAFGDSFDSLDSVRAFVAPFRTEAAS